MRWECPHCKNVKLAPSRPRMKDVRRYCLPCSERQGPSGACDPMTERELERLARVSRHELQALLWPDALYCLFDEWRTLPLFMGRLRFTCLEVRPGLYPNAQFGRGNDLIVYYTDDRADTLAHLLYGMLGSLYDRHPDSTIMHAALRQLTHLPEFADMPIYDFVPWDLSDVAQWFRQSNLFVARP